ncbi:unnamed protein product [Alternaria burnsii]|nr:unnamed protein product [Alternaria burnsii]
MNHRNPASSTITGRGFGVVAVSPSRESSSGQASKFEDLEHEAPWAFSSRCDRDIVSRMRKYRKRGRGRANNVVHLERSLMSFDWV